MTARVSARRLHAFLSDPRSYPEKPRAVHVMQTHASYVVLTGRRVFKVKKPVNFGFLDFSTLEKRRHFCEREVALNRRLCPGIHLGVVPISIADGRLVFGADGEVVEYAVEMRRLPERWFLPRLLARGRVAEREVDAIVATLAPFYKAHDPTPQIGEWGRVRNLRISTDENFRQTGDFVGVTITRPAFEAIREFTASFYRGHSALFAARIRERRIRDCHGDLHLDHIHLSPRRLTIYDCIEFNDRFRYIDVASDAAFLAMDFDFNGRPDLGRYFAARLASALRDPAMLTMLDFYKCYRAFVRGKVEGFHHVAANVPEGERRECAERAARYFRLALRYAVCGSEPAVFVVMGRVGAGKSTLARALGRELGWEVFSADRVRKELAGVPLHVRGSAAERRRLYAKAMSDRTYAALAKRAVAELREHRGVVLDATFSSAHRRALLSRILKKAGAVHCFIEVQAPASTIRRRLAARARSDGEVSDARLEDFAMLDRAYESPRELDRRSFLAVKTARTSESVVAATLRALALRAARSARQDQS
jgi:aminoglycoside phosphotransferase family enzyme/predicted kinase